MEESLAGNRHQRRGSRHAKNELDSQSESSDDEGSDELSNKELLEAMFWEFQLQRNGNDEEVLDAVVKILRSSPELASQRFEHKPYFSSATVPVNPHTTSHSLGVKLFPVTYLLIGGASLDTLKEVMELDTRLVHLSYEKMPDGNAYPMLHTACYHRPHETELIRHIACLKPRSLTTCSRTVSLPIHIALNKYAPLETIKTLLELCPESLTIFEYCTRMDFFMRALCHQNQADDSVIDLLVDSFLANDTTGEYMLASCTSERFVMTTKASKALLRITPKLRFLQCAPGHWTLSAWLHFVQTISFEDAFERLRLEPPWELPEDQMDAACQAFSNFIQETSLTALTVTNAFAKEDRNGKIFRSLLDGLYRGQHSSGIRDLHIDSLAMSRDANFANLLTLPSSLTRLVIRFLNCTGFPLTPAPEGVSCLSSVDDLCIFELNMSEPYAQELLSLVAEMPKLKRLELVLSDNNKWQQLMTPMATLIRRNTIEQLELRHGNDALDLSLLAEGLTHNTSLHRFHATWIMASGLASWADVLQHHNTTMTESNIANRSGYNSPEAIRIRYFEELNGRGRGQLRSETLSLDVFTGILHRTNAAPSAAQTEWLPFDGMALIYGLLRENPSLWCATATSGRKSAKRKRE